MDAGMLVDPAHPPCSDLLRGPLHALSGTQTGSRNARPQAAPPCTRGHTAWLPPVQGDPRSDFSARQFRPPSSGEDSSQWADTEAGVFVALLGPLGRLQPQEAFLVASPMESMQAWALCLGPCHLEQGPLARSGATLGTVDPKSGP